MSEKLIITQHQLRFSCLVLFKRFTLHAVDQLSDLEHVLNILRLVDRVTTSVQLLIYKSREQNQKYAIVYKCLCVFSDLWCSECYNCVAKLCCCHNMLSVVCLSVMRVYCDKTTGGRITWFYCKVAKGRHVKYVFQI